MNIKLLSLALVLSLAITSCYRAPDDSIFVEDLDMVVTNYDTEKDYKTAYASFSVADSFGLVTNVRTVTIDDANDPKLVYACTTSIIKNMEAYGYRYIPKSSIDTTDKTTIPDIYIPVTISYINTTGVAYYPIYSPGYGYGYPGYGYGGWGGYYYSWGYIPTTFSYDQGSLLVDLVDVKNSTILNDSVFLTDNVWNMGVSGLLESTTGDKKYDRLQKAIDIGFEQSPYLNKN